MRNSTANRTLVALCSSLLLSLSIAVLANGPCVTATPSTNVTGGACYNDGSRSWQCTADVFTPSNCNGTTANSLGCNAGSATYTKNSYGNLSCYTAQSKCTATANHLTATYYGNWGKCKGGDGQ